MKTKTLRVLEKLYTQSRKVLLVSLFFSFLFATSGNIIAAEGEFVIGNNTVSKNAQQLTVSGTITDANTGETLPGVTVMVDGTQNGTISDVEGKFRIDVSNADAVLVFSFIGFQSERVEIEGRSIINVKLNPDIYDLDEVVVVGYGTQKKVNLTGAVGIMPDDALESRAISSVGEGLQGLIPGLNISSGGGSLGNAPNINIRGITTIGEGSQGSPLILIDGMEGDMNALNPNDIENISVLKDAAASSIYGSRAPFGVILITTKSGKSGKMEVTYNNSFRSNVPIVLPDQMNSLEFVEYINIAHTNAGWGNRFSDDHILRIKDYMDDPSIGSIIPNPGNPEIWADGYDHGNDNVDWYDAIYRDSAPSQEHSLSVSGGNEKVNFYLSGNFLGQEGLMKLNQDNYQRYALNAKVNAHVTDWASISYQVRFTRQDYERPSALTNNLFQNLARQGWPTLPLYDPNGYLYSSPSPALALRDGGSTRQQTDWNYQQASLTLEPLEGWRILANVNYKIGDVFSHWDVLPIYNHNVAGDPYPSPQDYYLTENTEVHEGASRENYLSPNVYTEYNKSFALHNFKVMAGYQSELNKWRDVGATRIGIMIPSSPTINTTSGANRDGVVVPPGVNGSYTSWSLEGYFGRLNYNYDGKYLAEANLRYDGTSRFREDKRWKLFPSFSLGWNVAKEGFWEPLSNAVNLFKFRGSYGSLGNQNMDALYPTYVTMPFDAANGSWLLDGRQPNTASAPGLISSSLTWETVETWNVGADLGFFGNQLSANFDYYVRYTNNMIGPAPELPVVLGTGVPRQNNTDLKTSGMELSLNWRQRLDNGLRYSIGINLADSRTEITNYPNSTGDLGQYYEGGTYGDIWGYETIGIAKSDEQMDAHLEQLTNGGQDALGNNWQEGDIMYADLNEDGKIDDGAYTLSNHGDRKVIGNTQPRYLYGINLSADWKGVDLSMFWQGVGERDFWQGSPYFFGASSAGLWDAVAFQEHKDYYSADNPDGYFPRPNMDGGKNTNIQTRYLQDASYLRLKNLQIGYTLPESFTQRFLIQKLRFYVSGENLLTFTKMASMFDPETIDSDQANGEVGGWGGNAYPLTKVYSAGLSVTF